MIITLISKIDFAPTMRKIKSDDFWLFGAQSWHRIYSDYVPHDKGNLRDKVEIRPKEIEHYMPYARFIYYGMIMEDPKYGVGGFTNNGGIDWFSRPGIKKVLSARPMHMKNGTRLWDQKAKQDKKDLLLIRSMQNWIDKNL